MMGLPVIHTELMTIIVDGSHAAQVGREEATEGRKQRWNSRETEDAKGSRSSSRGGKTETVEDRLASGHVLQVVDLNGSRKCGTQVSYILNCIH